MKYAIGTEILLVHTGDKGRIIHCDPDGSYQVRLSGGFEIPAFEEDLRDITHGYHADAIKRSVPSQQEDKQKEQKQGPELIYAPYQITDPKGIYLALEAVPETDGSVVFYQIWIINEMTFPVIMAFDAYYASETLFQINQKLPGLAAFCCGRLHYDDLNDHPDVEVSVQTISTEGLAPAHIKNFRLRGKTVLNTQTTIEILDRPGWSIALFSPKTLTGTEQKTPNLTEYAQTVKPKTQKQGGKQYFDIRNIQDIASFIPEIDLHIEALVDYKGKMSNGEILSLQLMHFESFMEKATRMACRNVFIIHGVGEGVLRSAVSERLKQRKDVLKFHNQYHPKYGFGATEVIFRG
jgi:hypothetical protein